MSTVKTSRAKLTEKSRNFKHKRQFEKSIADKFDRI